MEVVEIISEITKEGANIQVVDDNIKLTTTASISAELQNEIRKNKEEIINFINGLKREKAISKAAIKDYYALSAAQRRLYFLYEFDRDSLAYNQPQIVKLEGVLDRDRLTNAFEKLVLRHESLRTSFVTIDDEVVQKISSNPEFSIEQFISDESGIAQILKGFIRPFDLSSAPLMRIGLVKISTAEHILMVDMHHIITDGTSRGVLIKDFMALYNNQELAGVALQYKDYSEWQQSKEQLTKLANEKQFWLNEFAEELTLLDLPTDFTRPNVKSQEGNRLDFSIDKETTRSLNELAEETGATMFMTVLSLFNVLLSKLSNQEDITIGTPVAGRGHTDLEGTIGMFINTVTLRNYPRAEMNFEEFLFSVKSRSLSFFDNQSYQYEELIEELQITRDTSRNPLFDVMFVYQNFEGEELTIPGLTLKPYDSGHIVAKFDLTLIVSESPDQLHFSMEYSTALYTAETISKFINYFKRLVTLVVKNPIQKLSKLNILSSSEQDELLNTFNDSFVDYPADKTIIELFETQVQQTPKNIALVCEEAELTYEGLNYRSNNLAAQLRALNVISETRVGILFESGIASIVSMLAVMKSGGAYVPLDPENPVERLQYQLADSCCQVLLSSNSLLESLNLDKSEMVVIDVEALLQEELVTMANLKKVSKDRDLAYIIYTSGTTGLPKGVMIEHASIYNTIHWAKDEYQMGSDDKVLQLVKHCFDGFIISFFTPIVSGSTVHLPYRERRVDAAHLAELIKNVGITRILCSPIWYLSILEFLTVEDTKTLKQVTLAGDAINEFVLKKSLEKAPTAEVVNEYGPTENSVVSTMFRGIEYGEKNQLVLPIGKPIANTNVYILGSGNCIQPIGVPGELCVSGHGIARGYNNNDALTNQKFIPDPFKTDQKLYRTGDLARWLPDGNVEFLGRLDNQVKIRGFRIELGEIENELASHSMITETLVLAKERDNNKYLVGYYVSDNEIAQKDLRSHLSIRLPDYMLPSYYVQLKSLPLTPNGKIDRKSLPDPAFASDEEFVAPRTKQEKILCDVWSKVLGIETVGITDNFFSVGGDSIKSIQITSRIRSAGYEMSVKDIFTSQTIDELALKLKLSTNVSDQSLVTGEVSLTGIQRWFFEGELQSKHHFNQAVMLNFPEGITETEVRAIFTKLQTHHDGLRMVYSQQGTEVTQQNKGLDHPLALTIEDLTRDKTPEQSLLKLCNRIQSTIDLENGPLMQLGLIDMNSGSRLLIVIHHLIIDGISWRILFEDIETLYQQLKRNSSFRLPPKTDSLQIWSEKLEEYSKSKSYKKASDYWSSLMTKKQISIARDSTNGANKLKDAITSDFKLNSVSTTKLLKEVHGAFNTQINDILLAAFLMSVSKHYGNGALQLDLEGHGREELMDGMNVSRTVGWFTSIYPIVLEKVDEDVSSLIKSVKESLRSIPNNGVDYLIGKYLTSNPQSGIDTFNGSKISFNYLGQFDSDIQNNAFEIATEATGISISLEEDRIYDWDVSGRVSAGQLYMSLSFSAKQYNEDTIAALMGSYQACLTELIDYCSNLRQVELTPSDLTYKKLTISELELLQAKFPIEDIYLLSPMQEGMLFHALMDEEADHYFEQMSYRLSGKLDIGAIEKSFQALVDRYDVLRTVFLHEKYDHPLQVVLKEREIDFSHCDIRNEIKNDNVEQVLEKYRQSDKNKKFDLSRDPLIRIYVYQIAEGEYEFIWSHHHILMDGWCMSIIINEFSALYSSHRLGTKMDLPSVQPYSKYIEWLNEREQEDSVAYWSEYLEGYGSLATLPKENKQPSPVLRDNVTTTLILSQEKTKSLQQLTRIHGITLNTIIQSAWGILLSKYNNTSDVVFGAVVSGRPAEIENIETMVGLFINTIPVRINYREEDRIEDLLKHVQEKAISGELHHYNPLSEIQSGSELGNSLLDHIMVFENYPIAEQVEGIVGDNEEKGSYVVTNVEVFEEANYDLSIRVGPGQEIKLHFDYNPEIYNSQMIDGVKKHLERIVQCIIEDSHALISSIDMLSSDDKNGLLNALNNASVNYPLEKTVTEIFQEQVSRNAGKIALVFENRTVTYQELDEKSSRLGHKLRQEGVSRDMIVGLLVDRSIDTVVGMLGILKAGGAYLPIDISYPTERIQYLLEDSRAGVLLTSNHGTLSQKYATKTLFIEDIEELSNESSELELINEPSDLCYIIYTSGTTGNPKGVMVEHRNVVRLFFNDQFQFDFGPEDVWTMFHSPSFDFSVWEIYGALLFGGKLIVVPKAVARDTNLYLDLLNSQAVTVLNQTPTAFYNLIQTEVSAVSSSLSLRYVIFGGEALSPMKLKSWNLRYPDTKLINMFGITETTVHVTYKEISAYEINNNVSAIGTPIPTLSVYILDAKQHLVPQGVKGEIYIGGAGVTRGYLNNEALTQKKFVLNPYNTDETLYRSGDMGRILSTGDIEYLGRMDEQVKIRGFRIELGEIESQLATHKDIKETVVTARETDGSKYLIGYYVSKKELEATELRNYLSMRLPDYMLPAYYVHLDSFPLTNNGKINSKALPDPEVIAGEDYTAPRTKQEKALCEVWSKVLGIENVGITDNFFSVGGDSIKSIQISSRMRNKGYEVSVKDIFTSQTIEELSLRLKESSRIPDQHPVVGEVPLTGIQHWFFQGNIKQKHHFNQAVMLNFPQGITEKEVKTVFTELQRHHDALRMVYREEGKNLVQENMNLDHPLSLMVTDLRKDKSPEKKLQKIGDDLQGTIDLEHGPLMRLGLFHLKSGSRLMIAIHHLVVDGISWRILFEDIDTLYSQIGNKIVLQLPLKTDSFQTWSLKLQEYLAKDSFQQASKYWNSVLNKDQVSIKKDNTDGTNRLVDVLSSKYQLDASTTTKLLTEVHSAFNTQINDLLLTALLISVKSHYGEGALKLDMEGHGREDILDGVDVSRTIGWFTSIYPVILEQKGEDLSGLIKSVKESLRSIPNKGVDYLIGKFLTKEAWAKAGITEQSRISFNYLGQFDSDTDDKSFQMASESSGKSVSQKELRNYEWDISGMISGGQLNMNLSFSSAQYNPESIESLMSSYKKNLVELIEYCIKYEKKELTPSDLSYNKLSILQLDKLQANHPVEDVYPLSPMQEGMLFHALTDDRADHYFEQMSYQLHGQLDISCIEESFSLLVQRYDILRSAFIHEGYDRSLQVVLKERKPSFSSHDIRNEVAQADREQVLQGYRQADKERKFNLSEDALMRVTVYQTGEAEYEFIWSHHHILMDGWCMGIIVNEFSALYRSIRSGTKLNLPKVQPYSDYIKWLENRDRALSTTYWKEFLSGYDTVATLPKGVYAYQTESISQSNVILTINAAQTKTLNQLTRRYGVTLNTIIQSAWGILLSRYNNVSDVVFGAVVSGRPSEIEGIETMVGLFINTIPIRISYNDGDSVSDLLQNAQNKAIASEPHHYSPLSEIQSNSELGNSLLDHVMVFENYPIADEIEGAQGEGSVAEDYKVTNVEAFEQTNYDLSVIVVPGDEITIKFDYNPDVYDSRLMVNLKGHLDSIIHELAANSEKPVSSLALLSPEEKNQLLGEFNDTTVDYPFQSTIIDLFEDQVVATPNNTALIIGEDRLSFEDLNSEANKLALKLIRKLGSGKMKVALLFESSFEMVIGMLGVLKAGCAYVPLSVEAPVDRNDYILQDCEADLLLTHKPVAKDGYIDQLSLPKNKVISIKTVSKVKKAIKNPPRELSSEDLIYVIYTSGTSGQPKGVEVKHKGLVNYALWRKSKYEITASDVTLQLFSYQFDGYGCNLFPSILSGGSLVLIPEEHKLNAAYISEVIGKDGVTNSLMTPTIYQVLLSEATEKWSQTLRLIELGGEKATSALLKESKKAFPQLRVANEYGPTESSICATYKEELNESNTSVIGKPIANTSIYILNRTGEIQPVGVSGELCISGEGIAKGYLNNEELTNQKFIDHPFKSGEKLYKTGDLARWLPDGNVEYQGRLDDQIKVRGFRIELEEIESMLSSHKDINESIVLAKGPEGEKYLVGYYVSETELAPKELRIYLAKQLPDYMLPSSYLHMEHFPLTPNGKLDRKALPDPELSSGEVYVAPRTHEEKLLCEIWASVLGVKNIGVTDNFFSVGGDSIKSIQISSRVRAAGYELAIKDIFIYQTIEELSLNLKSLRVADQSPVQTKVALTGIQSWFFEENIESKHHFNQAVMLNFPESVSEGEVRNIFIKLQSHHDALRMVFRQENSTIIQENKGLDHPLSIITKDLKNDKSAEIHLLKLCNELQSSINLETGPLMKLGLFDMKNGSRLVIVIHHLVIDGISWRILFEDIETLYQQVKRGDDLKLPLKTDSFNIWSEKLLEYAESNSYIKAAAYWNKTLTLNQVKPVRDHQEGANNLMNVTTLGFQLQKEATSQLLQRVNTAFNTQINDLLLAAFYLSVQDSYGKGALKIDLEGHGREGVMEEVDVSRTIGWFTSIYPAVLEYDGKDLVGLIKSIKESLRSIPNNGVDYLIGKYLSQHTPIHVDKADSALISFNYLGQFDSDTAENSYEIAKESTGTAVSLNGLRNYDWDVSGRITNGQLWMSISFSPQQYDQKTIETFINIYESHLVELITFCSEYGKSDLTPSDLTYKGLSISQLEQIQSQYLVEDIYPLAPMQEGMLYHSLLNEEADHYFEQMSYRLKGDLDISSVEKSFSTLIQRYDILRTAFLDPGSDRYMQVVLKERELDFCFVDVRSEVQSQGRDKVLSRYRLLDRSKKFDLCEDSLIRINVYKTDDSDYEFIWSHHHILMDGWCMSILINEFSALYNSYRNGNQIDLAKVQPYSTYINWLENQDKESARTYWTEYLEGYDSLAFLPKDISNKPKTAVVNVSTTLKLSKTETRSLQKLTRKYGVTLNTILQGIWGILLSKYNNVNDVVFGAVVSGRPAEVKGIETMVGLFINTIPVRISYEEKDSLRDLFNGIQDKAIEAEPYHYNLLSEIQSDSELGMGLLDHIMVFENYPISEEIEGQTQTDERSYSVTNVDVFEQTNYDLSITIIPGSEIRIDFDYNNSIYDAAVIERAKGHFSKIVHHVIADDQMQVTGIDILSEDEKSKLLYEFNDTSLEYPQNKTIIDLFEDQVRMVPDQVALILKEQELSYKELNERSNQLTNYLMNLGIEEDGTIGIMVDRSIEMIISIIAVMKMGRAYVPVDIAQPEARVRHILEDSNVKYLLSEKQDQQVYSDIVGIIDIHSEEAYSENSENLQLSFTPSQEVYVIYTSGSTGVPKGVVVSHKSIVNLVYSQKENYDLTADEKILQFSNVTFDTHAEQIWLALLNGASLVLISRDILLDKALFNNYVIDKKISHVDATPSFLSTLEPQADHYLKRVVSGGEKCSVDLLRRFSDGCDFFNAYGPTETTSTSVQYKYDPNKATDGSIPIGRPIGNTTIYILSGTQDLQPLGAPGELCIGGDGLSYGYLNNESLTKERFIDNPYQKGTKIYKTGDLARWLPDGNIEYLGRLDDQVKIRGFRIELGEIESQLSSLEEIKESVVLVKEKEGDKYLVGYYVAEKELEISTLRDHLAASLPDYMLPTYFVHMEFFPRTINDKLDKRKLPEPEFTIGQNYVAPTTEIEVKLVEVWSEVLQIDKETISTNQSFFELGGHSLKATVLVNKISKVLEVDVPLRHVFTHPDVRSLGILIADSAKSVHSSIEKAIEKPHYALSSAQRRLHFLYEFDRKSLAYNMPQIVRLEGVLDRSRLEKALNELIKRHETLRTSFELLEEEVVQKINRDVPFELEYHDSEESEIQTLVEAFISPFDLSQAPLMRTGLIKLSEETHVLMVDMHHIIGDGVSEAILIKDFMALYNQEELPELQLQYKDYSEWRMHAEQQENHSRDKEFWIEEFSAEVSVLDLPTDYLRPVIKSYKGSTVSFSLSAEETAKLRSITASEGATLFMTTLSIFNIVLSKLSNQEEIVVGTTVAGRDHADLEGIMGMFLNILTLRNFPKAELSFGEFLASVKEKVLSCFEHQSYQYEELIEELDIARDTSRNPLFDVLLEYGNFDKEELIIPGLTLKPHSTDHNVAKFDLTLTAIESEEQLHLNIEYATELFKVETIERFIEYFRNIVSAITSEVSIKLSDIDILSQVEKQQLLYQFNQNTTDYDIGKTVIDLFKDQVIAVPTHIALIQEEVKLNYTTFYDQINRTSNYLSDQGVSKGDVVLLMSDNSIELVVHIYAIIQMGAVYVPLDPNYPMERIQRIVEQSGAALILCQEDYSDILLRLFVPFLMLDEQEVKTCPNTFECPEIDHKDLAYIIYTSGSSGQPKGVKITHGALFNYINWAETEYVRDEICPMALFTSVSFDLTITSLFLPITTGNSLAIYSSKAQELSVEKVLSDKHAKMIKLTPAHLNLLCESDTDFSGLERVVVGGEEFDSNLASKVYERSNGKIEMYNEYGPTEGTVGCIIHKYNPAQVQLGKSLLIGKPTPNCQIYILNDHLNLVPVKSVGEICIGGAQLFQGYFGMDEMTNQKLIPNPYKKGELLYKTGDLGCWHEDGNIEFFGRVDDQVKIRGFRIELGEIESQLSNFENVKECLVLSGQTDQDKYLTGYYVSEKEIAPADIRHYLADKLPDYMIPAYYVHMETFPLTSNGKIDKALFPEPEIKSGEDYVAPRSEVEKTMSEIWSQVLGIETIGIVDNFFTIGGNSLKAAKVINNTNKAFQSTLSLMELFNRPTIEGLAEVVELVLWSQNGEKEETEKRDNKKSNTHTF